MCNLKDFQLFVVFFICFNRSFLRLQFVCSSSSSFLSLFVLLLPRFIFVCCSTFYILPVYLSSQFYNTGGVVASFCFSFFSVSTVVFFLVDVPVTIFCVFFFNSPASSSPSLGSIISNKRTLLFCSPIWLLVLVLKCVGMNVCLYVCRCVSVTAHITIFCCYLLSRRASIPSWPNFRNRQQKGILVPEMREGFLLIRFRWFASVFILYFSVSTSRTYSSSLSPSFHFEHLGILELYASCSAAQTSNSIDFFWFLAFTITTSFWSHGKCVICKNIFPLLLTFV